SFEGNPQSSKLAFSVMARMASIWGGPDLATIQADPQPPRGQPEPVIPGFDAFMLERFHGVCWEVMRDPQFRPEDAQTRQVLAEIAALEQVVYRKTGNVFIEHVRTRL